MAVHHYPQRTEHGLFAFLAFHDDGLFMGTRGCQNYWHANLAGFKSTEGNGAAKVNPDLCPLGSYGFDPRCRDWYDSAKRKAHDKGIPLYVTAPYRFAIASTFAQSAVSALIDPTTGAYVGAGLYDFVIGPILDALSPEITPLQNGGFPLLITPGVDNFGGDVVIGPGWNESERALSVLQFKFHPKCF